MPTAIVVGGGVIGLAVAWRVAQQGMTVTVVDPSPGRGASHVAAGMLTPVSEAAVHEKELFRLGVASLDRYPAFVAELTAVTGEPTGFRRTGTLQVGYDADDLAVLEELHVLQESMGARAQRLTGRQCRALEPMLDPAIRGGLLVEDDGSVDPRLLTRALLTAVDRCGVQVVRRSVADVAVSTAGDRVTGVRLADTPRCDEAMGADRDATDGEDRGAATVGTDLAADWVILAAGWQAARFAALPPACRPPVRPVKGQVLRLHADEPLIGRSIRGVVEGSSVYLVPRDSGEIVIGATQEERGEDAAVTAGGVWELLRDAHAVVPGITELRFDEVAAGLRPGTPDNAPILGPTPLPGLVLATGHFRNGILLAPVTADVVAEYLVTGRLPDVASHFTIDRFTSNRRVADAAEASRP